MLKIFFLILLSVSTTIALNTNRGIDISIGYPYSESLREYVYDQSYPTTYTFFPRNTTSKINVEMYTSLQDVYQNLRQNIIAETYIPGSFKYSAQSKIFSQASGNYTAFTYQYFKLIDSPNSGVISQDFSEDYSLLPEEFTQESCGVYKYFIKKYGTHTIHRAALGGQIVMSSSFSPEIFDKRGEINVGYLLTDLFNLFLKPLPLSPDDSEYFENLMSEYPSTIEIIGGNSEKYSTHMYKDWVNTIPVNPVLLDVMVQQLSGKDLHKAVNIYLNNNTLLPSILLPKLYPTALIINDELTLVGGMADSYDYSLNTPIEIFPIGKYIPNWELQPSHIPSFPMSTIGEYNGKIFYISENNSIASFDMSSHFTKVYTHNTTYSTQTPRLIYQGVIYFFGRDFVNMFSIDTLEIRIIPSNMAYFHRYGSAVYCDNLIYIVGGDDSGFVETFDPSSLEWKHVKNLKDQRSLFQALCISEEIYAVGGNIFFNDSPNIINIERFTNGKWEIITNFPLQRSNSASVNLNNNILIIGGQELSNPQVGLLNIDVYNIVENTWNLTPIDNDSWC